jgi:hypothetical protein
MRGANSLLGPKASSDSPVMVETTSGVQTANEVISRSHANEDRLAGAVTHWDLGRRRYSTRRQRGRTSNRRQGEAAHFTLMPFSLTIWLDSARVKATMAPLVEE